MKTRRPEIHPVDEFFQLQAERIPVVYDPQQWEHLRAMLDLSQGDQKPTSGQASPPESPAAQPGPSKWPRHLWPTICFLALMQLLPSANPQAHWLDSLPTRPAVLGQPATLRPAAPARPRGDAPVAALPVLGTAAPARPGASPTPATAAAAQETIPAETSNPAEALIDAASKDSLMLIPPPPAPPRDSLAEQRKLKRKHLFW